MLPIEYLAGLVDQYRDCLSAQVKGFTLGGRDFAADRSIIMGVINLSTDSWYRESVCLSTEAAIARGKVLAAQGADIVDVGAESTLSNAARVDEGLQSRNLIPVVKGLRESGVLVSAETYQLGVAKSCLKAGANVLNLTGTLGTADMFRLAADHDAAVIICYVQGKNVREVADFDFQKDPVEAMYAYFADQVELAKKQGLEKIWIDPGMGFYYRNLQDSAVRIRHQMTVFLNTFRLRKLGVPICHALPHAFEFFGEEVRAAEGFFAVLAALGKTNLFRTHEVPRTRAVLRTMEVF